MIVIADALYLYTSLFIGQSILFRAYCLWILSSTGCLVVGHTGNLKEQLIWDYEGVIVEAISVRRDRQNINSNQFIS